MQDEVNTVILFGDDVSKVEGWLRGRVGWLTDSWVRFRFSADWWRLNYWRGGGLSDVTLASRS